MRMRVLVLLLAFSVSAFAQKFPFPGGHTAHGGGSVPTFVNSDANWLGGGAVTTAFSPANGDDLIVWVIANNASATCTVADGEGTGNTYNLEGSIASTLGANKGFFFRAHNISGSGAYTITASGGTCATPGIAVIEASHITSLAGTSTGTNPSGIGTGGATITPAGFTPSAANTLLIDGYGEIRGDVITLTQVDTNFTIDQECLDGSSCYQGAIGHRAVSSAAAYTDGWTANDFSANIGMLIAYQ